MRFTFPTPDVGRRDRGNVRKNLRRFVILVRGIRTGFFGRISSRHSTRTAGRLGHFTTIIKRVQIHLFLLLLLLFLKTVIIVKVFTVFVIIVRVDSVVVFIGFGRGGGRFRTDFGHGHVVNNSMNHHTFVFTDYVSPTFPGVDGVNVRGR